ncbi:MAG: glycosyltransferase family 4 protein [Verrucomicrobia bacterium]|nr:glycosyltransferase family 4 protein [Verrucomicrobiota bacterium]
MHICFICDEYPPAPHGGSGSSYRDLSEGLVAQGHQVTVVGVYKNPQWHGGKGVDETINGVRVVRLPSSPSWLRYKLQTLSDRLKISRWLKCEHQKNPFDIIEASDYGGWLRFGGPAGVPTIVRIRGSNYFFDVELKRNGDPFEHKIEEAALARADFIGSVSRYASERTLDICKLSHRSCTVIHNAVDMDLFSPSPGVSRERGLIVFVNSINPKKGIEQLIDAMNVVCAKFPEAKLAVIGQDTQKPVDGITYVEKLKQRMKPEFLDRVIFTGRMDRYKGVLDYLRRAHICCYPSHMETFGIAAIEAMSIGKPTIFSETGPGPEVIEHGVSGLLCNPHDALDLADKIVAILSSDELAERLGTNARCRVETLFNKKHWVQRNVEFYERCISSNSHENGRCGCK